VERVAKPLNLTVEEAAQAILDVTAESMLGALRVVSIQRGRDPSRFALLAFGGAGPLHANALAALSGSFPVIVPPHPGVLSAYGGLASDFHNEFTAAVVERFEALDLDDVRSTAEGLLGEAEAWLDGEDIPPAARTIELEADLRYFYQVHEVSVGLSLDEIEPGMPAVAERFSELHERLFGFRLDTDLELVNIRAKATGAVERPALEVTFPSGTVDDAVTGESEAVFDGRAVPIRIYDRDRLPANAVVPGPAIITQMDSNTVVLPEHRARMDAAANILIEPV
jgi:N-methylhydantoinase A